MSSGRPVAHFDQLAFSIHNHSDFLGWIKLSEFVGTKNAIASVESFSIPMFVRRIQSLDFNRSPLTVLLAEAHVYCWNTLTGSLSKCLKKLPESGAHRTPFLDAFT